MEACLHSPKSSKANDESDCTNNAAPSSDPIVIGQADVRTAYLQADRFGPNEPRRYLKV